MEEARKVLLKKGKKEAGTIKDERISPTCNRVNDTNSSSVQTVAAQDLPMYSYNPLRMKEK